MEGPLAGVPRRKQRGLEVISRSPEQLEELFQKTDLVLVGTVLFTRTQSTGAVVVLRTAVVVLRHRLSLRWTFADRVVLTTFIGLA